MTRIRILAALALAVTMGACGKTKVSPPGTQLRQPSAVAVFRGITIESPTIAPYFAIANGGRDDISIVNATNDQPVLAPVQFRTLVVPVQDRPAILVSASLGDGPDNADLLVAIASGDSHLQLVETWTATNEVVDTSTVDATGDVLAAVALPGTAPGTARIALALSGRRIAVATYARSGAAIVPVSLDAGRLTEVSAPLAFQPVALAAMPDDPTRVYAATRDVLDAAAVPPVFGVAVIDVSGAAPVYAGALDARAPTRLVAAARLRERAATSAAADETAFVGQPEVDRVYAVLDESGCGPDRRIDCGVAILDPATGRLLPDLTGRMPYLAPIRLPTRVLALATSGPTALPPSQEDAKYALDLMRVWPVPGVKATTAVAAAACDDGRVYFLDLGRWNAPDDALILGVAGTNVSSVLSTPVSLPAPTPGALPVQVRVWVVGDAGEIPATASDVIAVTPGWTRSETFAISYEEAPPGMTDLPAEAGVSGGQPWLAMQVADRTATSAAFTDVVRLWDPQLFVHPGDIVQIDAAGVPGCAGTEAPGALAGSKSVFWTRIAALLPPSADYPGGAVQLAKETQEPLPTPPSAPAPAPPAVLDNWGQCFDALTAVAASAPLGGLTATLRVGDFSVVGDASGYVGHAALGQTFALEYPSAANEDTLPACPLIPWPADPTAVACDATCRSGCEALVLARKARRFYHVAEACAAEDAACLAKWPGLPNMAGPLVRFRLGIVSGDQAPYAASTEPPRRGMLLRIITLSGVFPFGSGAASGQVSLTYPTGAIPFDRSPYDAGSGYRFLVPYQSNTVIDTTGSLAGGASIAIQ